MKSKKKETLGDLLDSAMDELQAILDSGKHPRDVLTVRTVAVADPSDFTPKHIKSLRKSLRMSVALFAQTVGVSAKLVEQWESGRRKPTRLACRFLDVLKREPAIVLNGVVRGAA